MLFANEENVSELLRRLELYAGLKISWDYAGEPALRLCFETAAGGAGGALFGL